MLAFRDINPQAPTHILVIPKRRQGLTQLNKARRSHSACSLDQSPRLALISHLQPFKTPKHQATDEQKGVLGALLVAAAKVAAQEKLDGKGYRVVINTGEDGGNTVKHLHLHILGGRPLAWCVLPAFRVGACCRIGAQSGLVERQTSMMIDAPAHTYIP